MRVGGTSLPYARRYSGRYQTAPTVLQLAAYELASNTFLQFEQASMATTSLPLAGGDNGAFAADFVEDGSLTTSHTAISWAGTGVHDPVSRRVTWASCGANNMTAGNWHYNTQPIYDEVANVWTVNRSFRGSDEGSNVPPIGHIYSGNAIDISGRKFYRKKFSVIDRTLLQYDLDTLTWGATIATPTDESATEGFGGLEWIPTLGSSGRLWLAGVASSNSHLRLWEWNGTSWSTLIETTGFPGNGTFPNGVIISYNPRADAVLIGNESGVWTVDCQTLTVTVATDPGAPIQMEHDAHLCRDPVGLGWIIFAQDGHVYRTTTGATWVDRGTLPGRFATPGFTEPMLMVPIDVHRVIWFFANDDGAGGARAWLYKP